MEAEVKHPLRLSASILFDSLFPIMILTAFAAGGLYPIHYAALAMGVVLAMLAVLVKQGSDFRRVAVPVIVISCFGMVLVGQWPLILAVTSGVFFVWRVLSRSNHVDAHQITTIQLIVLLIVFIAAYSFQLTYDVYPTGIILLSLTVGFLLYSAAPYFSSYSGKKAVRIYVKWSVLFTVAAVTVYLLIDPFRRLIFGAADLMIAGITYLLFLTGLDIDIPEVKMEDLESSESGELTVQDQFSVTEIEETVSIGTLEMIVLIGGILLAAFLIRKMMEKFNRPLSKVQVVQENITIVRDDLEKAGNQKNVIPNHFIRKEMLKLEKKAQKKNAGRRKSETVREWFTRLNLQHAHDYAGIYEKIRYADKEITESEYKAFEQFVKDFEKKINIF